VRSPKPVRSILTGLVLVVSGIHYLYQALVYLSQHVPELFS